MRHHSRFHLAVAALFFTLAMFSSIASACTYTLNPSSKSHTSAAGSATFILAGYREGLLDFCVDVWTPVSHASFITITSAPSFVGSGAVSYSVSANTGAARSGTITIGPYTFTVNQSAGVISLPAITIPVDPCVFATYSISPASRSYDADGGLGSFDLSTTSTCPWTVTVDNPDCIYDVNPTSGSGSATINYKLAGNSGTLPVSCVMHAAGHTFTLNLGGCTYALGQYSASLGSTAGSGTVAVNPSGWACPWTSTSNASWITVTSGASGEGGGTMGYSVAPNLTGAARTGTVTIRNQVFTVNQDAGPVLPNYSDSYWNASESGWGLTLTDHGSNMFVQWYTYDATGHNQKYVISGGTFTADKCQFSGTITHASGPSWNAPAFDPSFVIRTTAGTGLIDFCPVGLPAGTIVFYYTADGVTGSKQLTRLPFGNDVPHWGGSANTGAPDYTDLWWNPAESGWGVSVTQHGNNLFFRIFVYDVDGRPLLFVVPGVTFNTASSFTGSVQLTSGPWFGGASFDPAQVVRTTAGSATLSFSDANNGVLTYTVNGTTKTKAITRMAF